MPLSDVDTPALLIDLDVFEKNLQTMAAAAAEYSIRLRPHAKTHKCPVIALKQMAQGAVGVCCQKVSEAEAMVYGGVPDVLITNEIVGLPKLRRVAALSKQATIGICVDDAENVKDLNRAASEFGTTLPVYVELDVGTNRCGVDSGEPVLRLAKAIEASPALRFAGLQAYHGAAQHVRSFTDRKEAVASAVEKVKYSLDVLKKNGILCPIVTGAGTGSYRFEGQSEVFGELQAGSYIFMDADYARNLDENGDFVGTFEHSLFVYTTVMSRPAPDRAVADAGLKALSVDSGMPSVVGYPSIAYIRASDEHGKMEVKQPDCPIKLGDKIKLIPGHCDPTVNLYDCYVGIRNGRVEALWPIAARGAVV
jgi:D-serine deaminase-like pyridoxal phosphate-dependent protein